MRLMKRTNDWRYVTRFGSFDNGTSKRDVIIEIFSRVVFYFAINLALLTSSVTSLIVHLMQSHFEQNIVRCCD